MKFLKGVLVGSMFCAGTMIMYKEGLFDCNKVMKKCKKIAKKMKI